ncbi:uncharacterized protein CXQ87_004347 [Candidozyma duobushaemuli]|uniref:Oxidoreductase-like domain-containing protein n=2 Tax=Candidozyma TaxID=3303203 RepID=A0ABX8I932_9ASCO|nr:uncharacterized protein CXQ87_004347 [[Candida] duobushaemulonis]PVH16792.1 hypothetical protein CXQ87_004347 [[Candida] duobushaemulonis]QWU89597.1 hypothetical protein CA3LBN_003945 [[Candida] haemuloni]
MLRTYRQMSTSLARSSNKFAFYDLVLRTPTHPRQPIEAVLMKPRELEMLKGKTKTTFEGNYALEDLSAEERIAKVFGGRIKGEERQSSSRVNVGEPRIIAGVTVPDKPKEPDNCCMSGCINCVWELYNDDVKDWNDRRALAAGKLKEQGGLWPADFYPPVKLLNKENIPEELAKASDAEKDSAAEEAWGGVPVAIRVFAQTEKRLKAKRRQRSEAA